MTTGGSARRLLRRGMFALGVLAILALPSAPAHAAIITYSGTGGAIADYDTLLSSPGQTIFTITVPDLLTLQSGSGNLLVRLIGLQHSFAGDLTVTLTHVPTGISRDLFGGIGAPSDFDGNYVFSSAQLFDLWATAGALGDIDVIPGSPVGYFTTNAGSSLANDFSSAFAGLNAAGDWRLTILDGAEGDTGNLLGWELEMDLTNVPEPSTGVAVAIGAAVLIWMRRRHP